MALSKAQEKVLKNFLLVKKGKQASSQRILTTYFKQPENIEAIEKGRREYPLEFVEHLHILVPEVFLLKIYEEVVASLNERKERAMVLICEVIMESEDLAEIEVKSMLEMKTLQGEIGSLDRTEHGINVAKLHDYCRAHSQGNTLYTHVHTHTSVGNIEISMADKMSYQLGQLAFVAAVHDDGGLALVPYRMDSKIYKEADSFDFTHFRAFTLAVIVDHPQALDKSVLDNFTRHVNQQLVDHD